jgi:hypothetical protein
MQTEASLPQSQQPGNCHYRVRDQTSPNPHPNSRWSILILSPHLSLILPSGLFSLGSSTKVLYAPVIPLSSHSCHTTHPTHSSWFDHDTRIHQWNLATKKRLFTAIECVFFTLERLEVQCHSLMRNQFNTNLASIFRDRQDRRKVTLSLHEEIYYEIQYNI